MMWAHSDHVAVVVSLYTSTYNIQEEVEDHHAEDRIERDVVERGVHVGGGDTCSRTRETTQ